MPEDGITTAGLRPPPAILRVYCICGQKMKVSESMLGQPGECVACRQEIRIPTLDEWPPNTEEVHLKDHPEFLRKEKRGGPVLSEVASYRPATDAGDPGVVTFGDARKRPKPAWGTLYRLSMVLSVLAAFAMVALTALLTNFGGYLDKLTPGNSDHQFTKTNVRRYQDQPRPGAPVRVQDSEKSSVTDKGFVKPAESPKDVATLGTPSTTQATPTSPASSAPTQETIPSPPSPPPANKIEIELRGLLMKGGREAKFAITLYPPDGPPKNLVLKLGDVIFGPWTIRELNQERQTLTVGNGNRLIVLDRGKRATLDL